MKKNELLKLLWIYSTLMLLITKLSFFLRSVIFEMSFWSLQVSQKPTLFYGGLYFDSLELLL